MSGLRQASFECQLIVLRENLFSLAIQLLGPCTGCFVRADQSPAAKVQTPEHRALPTVPKVRRFGFLNHFKQPRLLAIAQPFPYPFPLVHSQVLLEMPVQLQALVLLIVLQP